MSIRLQKKGYEVHVYEKNAYLGGKLTYIKKDGYRFDAGPSLLTMPYLIDEVLQLAGHQAQTLFKYKQLETACKYFFADGTELTAYSDPKKREKEFKEKIGIEPNLLRKYLAKTKYIWKITAPIFLYKSLHKIRTYLSIDTLWRVLNLPFIGMHQSMYKFNRTKLKNEKAVQYFNRFATYNGSNPYKAPSTLNVIAYLEHFEGAYYPLDSMISINTSLVKAAKELGVHFHLNSQVEEIVVSNKRVKAIKVNGAMADADIVISNADVYTTYQNLLPNNTIPKYIKEQERSSSALIFYWGINKEFHNLDVHNILFSKDYKQEFKEIWQDKKVPQDPTVYINISSKYNKKDAPSGSENWFVMINVPGNLDIDWPKQIDVYRKYILEKIKQSLEIDVTPYIEVEETLTPLDIQNKTASHLGALYGSASNDKLAAFFRHSNQLKAAKNLYAIGGSVHPGGGIPLCLLSAKITDEMIPKP